MSDKLLYSTKELFDTYIKGKKYNIPAYQRGYKWDTKDINRLLEDIDKFIVDDDLDLFYCLQNITLVKDKTEPFFNVVDGQQRLTTLTVILSYFKEFDLIKGKLKYSVREETEDFLNNYIYSDSSIADYVDWDGFLETTKKEGKDYDYQDIYYLFNAYRSVKKWFSDKLTRETDVKDKILNNVKLIINLPKNVDEQELFENLNGKRVPLDGADLIRALIITRIPKNEIGEANDSVKQNVLVNERRVKIGIILDTINQWWTDKNRQEYFGYFQKNIKTTNQTVDFNDKKYPIDILYKLYVLAYDGILNLDYFEEQTIKEDFFNKLQELQRIIENWYNDKELYHLIAYTYIYASDANKEKELPELTFKTLYAEWKKDYRLNFIRFLKDRIKNIPAVNELIGQKEEVATNNEEVAFNEDWYNDNKIISISVLLDISRCINSENFLPAKSFKCCKEDKEHIFPQTPIGEKIKDKDKQTQTLFQYIEIINTLKTDGTKIEVKEEDVDWDNENWKSEIKQLINGETKELLPINSLGNVCLLDESINRGYGNDFFLEKRIDIMRKSQEGVFIRPHVYEAFNKVFIERQNNTIEMEMMRRWDKTDILARRMFIINQIRSFLN